MLFIVLFIVAAVLYALQFKRNSILQKENEDMKKELNSFNDYASDIEDELLNGAAQAARSRDLLVEALSQADVKKYNKKLKKHDLVIERKKVVGFDGKTIKFNVMNYIEDQPNDTCELKD